MNFDGKIEEKKSEKSPCVATVGFFDGVHLGHRFLLGCVTEEARKRGLESVAVTFPDSPLTVLRPELDIKLLSTAEEKERLLHEAGISRVAMLPFTRDLANLTAEQFMQQVLREQLDARVLVMGYDHRFGRGGSASYADCVRIGGAMGIEVLRAPQLTSDVSESFRPVSSSAIRSALQAGEVEQANRGLGYEYMLEGIVVGGYHVGTSLGYPTANISVSARKLIPANGVYAVRVRVGEHEAFGMLNIGSRPTLDNGHDISIEVNIFDFHENIYSEKISISVVRFIREEQKFSSTEALIRQLQQDEQVCRRIFSGC